MKTISKPKSSTSWSFALAVTVLCILGLVSCSRSIDSGAASTTIAASSTNWVIQLQRTEFAEVGVQSPDASKKLGQIPGAPVVVLRGKEKTEHLAIVFRVSAAKDQTLATVPIASIKVAAGGNPQQIKGIALVGEQSRKEFGLPLTKALMMEFQDCKKGFALIFAILMQTPKDLPPTGSDFKVSVEGFLDAAPFDVSFKVP